MKLLRRIPKKARRVDVVRCSGHLAHVRKHFCVVPDCTRKPIEAMHVVPKMRGRGASKTGDDRTVPGCHWHHQEAKDSYHKLGRDKFAARHGIDLEAAIAEVNRSSKPLQRYYARQRAMERAAA